MQCHRLEAELEQTNRDEVSLSEVPSDCRIPIIVAERAGSIVGWALVHLEREAIAIAFVDPDQQTEPVTQALLDGVTSLARPADIDRLPAIVI